MNNYLLFQSVVLGGVAIGTGAIGIAGFVHGKLHRATVLPLAALAMAGSMDYAQRSARMPEPSREQLVAKQQQAKVIQRLADKIAL